MIVISLTLKLIKVFWTIIKYLLLKIIDKLINIGVIILLIYIVYLIMNYYLL